LNKLNKVKGRLATKLRVAVVCAVLTNQLAAEEILVAVAANFIQPMTDIAALFEAESGHDVSLASGSSGRFVAQIRNGAPFQIFLSADQERVTALVNSGDAIAETQFTYATGALVLWTARDDVEVDGSEVLTSLERGYLALANPQLAPYGRAAMEVLDSLSLTEQTRPRWVQGENIAQTYQFVETGNAEFGFVAASQIAAAGSISRGSGWLVPQELHSPIHQDAVLLSRAADCGACRQLLDFLRSEASQKIITAAGYRVGTRD
jgi:molybdate transport system substrate-binding protein